MTLTEYKSDTHHYFRDENWKIQGPYKSWWDIDISHVHCFYVKDRRHGELKKWDFDGQLLEHRIYIQGDQTDIPIPNTDEDRFAICLEHGHMEFFKE